MVDKATYVTLQKALADKPRTLAKLSKLPHLEVLVLSGSNVDDDDAATLAACTGLKSLDLSRTEITSAGVAALAALPQLVTLRLEETELNDSAAEHLVKHRGLKRLYLAQTDITDETLKKIQRCPRWWELA